MIQPVIITWSNWQWSKEYTPFGPTEYYLDRSKVQWSKWFGPRNTLTPFNLPVTWCAEGRGGPSLHTYYNNTMQYMEYFIV